MRNQERRRAKKKGRDARQRSRAAAGGRAGFGDQPGFGDEPGVGDEADFIDWDAYGNSFGSSSLGQLTTEEALSSLLTVIFQADDSTASKEVERGASRLRDLCCSFTGVQDAEPGADPCRGADHGHVLSPRLAAGRRDPDRRAGAHRPAPAPDG